MPQKLISLSPEETIKFGKQLAEKLVSGTIVALYGELGSGKTQIVKGICEALGVKQIINSPTFIIVNDYTSVNFDKIYHFDFYRLKSLDEALDIGFKDYLNTDGLILIEWPEIIESILPENTIKIYLSHNFENEFTREIKYEIKCEI